MRYFYHFFLATALLFANTNSIAQAPEMSYKEQYDIVDKKIKNKKLSEFLKWYLLPQKEKFAFIETFLGKSLYVGNHFPIDFQKSFLFFKSASEKGLKEAQFNLGLMYVQGKGTQPNEEEALKWFISAAKQGHIDAAFYAGLVYLKINQNNPSLEFEQELLNWWRFAAEKGHPQAKYWLNILEQSVESQTKQDEK